ncbi:MAG: IS630 family transposase, partial [Chloroflexota bacterium]|nr:IS630 family transposase [Chloroflexota bacterium]
RARAPPGPAHADLLETWFGILSREAIARGSFEAVRALVAAIEGFIRKWDDGATPFVWVKSADEILAKAVRKAKETSVTGH